MTSIVPIHHYRVVGTDLSGAPNPDDIVEGADQFTMSVGEVVKDASPEDIEFDFVLFNGESPTTAEMKLQARFDSQKHDSLPEKPTAFQSYGYYNLLRPGESQVTLHEGETPILIEPVMEATHNSNTEALRISCGEHNELSTTSLLTPEQTKKFLGIIDHLQYHHSNGNYVNEDRVRATVIEPDGKFR